jgi:hypothetical protein
MRDRPTGEEVSFYTENGFVVLPEVLTSAECATWLEVADGAARRRVTRTPLEGTRYDTFFHAEDEYYNSVFTQRINLWMTDPAVKDLVLDVRLGQIAAELAGVPAVRIWLDQALIKRAVNQRRRARRRENLVLAARLRNLKGVGQIADDLPISSSPTRRSDGCRRIPEASRSCARVPSAR